jgi:spoIIIJ-associated protein
VTELSQPTARARQLLADLLGHMGIAATVSVRLQRGADEEESREQTILDVTGDDLGLLIGWRGETLRALQTVVNLMAGSDEPQRPAVIVDVERYRGRREEQIRDLALRLAERVKRSGERYALEPMRAFERRVVHLALKDDEGVRTESVGKEPARKIVIHPTGQGKVEPRERYDRRDRRRGGDGGWRGAR